MRTVPHGRLICPQVCEPLGDRAFILLPAALTHSGLTLSRTLGSDCRPQMAQEGRSCRSSAWSPRTDSVIGVTGAHQPPGLASGSRSLQSLQCEGHGALTRNLHHSLRLAGTPPWSGTDGDHAGHTYLRSQSRNLYPKAQIERSPDIPTQQKPLCRKLPLLPEHTEGHHPRQAPQRGPPRKSCVTRQRSESKTDHEKLCSRGAPGLCE